MIQIFRRPESFYEAARFKLRGLQANSTYVLTELNRGVSTTLSGSELMEKGLRVSISEQPGVAVYAYELAK